MLKKILQNFELYCPNIVVEEHARIRHEESTF